MKVALYARTATQRQGDDGAASQIEVLRAYANEQGFEVTEPYVGCDPNHSGATWDRPGLNRLRCGAEAKAFHAVLILTPDRLSRNCRNLIHIIEEFKRWAVRIVFVEEHIQPTLPHGIAAIRGQATSINRPDSEVG